MRKRNDEDRWKDKLLVAWFWRDIARDGWLGNAAWAEGSKFPSTAVWAAYYLWHLKNANKKEAVLNGSTFWKYSRRLLKWDFQNKLTWWNEYKSLTLVCHNWPMRHEAENRAIAAIKELENGQR